MNRSINSQNRERVSIRRFRGNGRAELHAVIHPFWGCQSIEKQICEIEKSVNDIICSERLGGHVMKVAMKRLFLSDSVNQSGYCSSPCVGQPPASGCKVAALVILTESDSSEEGHKEGIIQRGKYVDIWTHITSSEGVSLYEASVNSLETLDRELISCGFSLNENCVRTWFFVRDIDAVYPEMVKGRNDVFNRKGLTADTHFIASTGIGAELSTPRTALHFESLSVGGLVPGQTVYLKAPSHLNSTTDYGVAFERATAVEYGDRRVVYISGTASIDARGEIFAAGDVEKQAMRMCDNVDALLDAGGCNPEDVMHIVAYVRDASDFQTVRDILESRYPGIPLLEVNGNVCRPGWLVEMECIAMHPQTDARYAPY